MDDHPSGNIKPGRSDEELTFKIKEAAKYHELRVLDHLKFSSEGYFSFADKTIGLFFNCGSRIVGVARKGYCFRFLNNLNLLPLSFAIDK